MFVREFELESTVPAYRLGLGNGSNGSNEPTIEEQVEDEVKKSIIKEIIRFFGNLFNFGPKTIGYLQKDEVEKVLDHPRVFRYAFMSPGCGLQIPLTPCTGSFFSNAPYRAEQENFWMDTFPFNYRDYPIVGDWYNRNFGGVRASFLEPGLSNQPGWFYFDSKTLAPVDFEGIAAPGGKLYDIQRHRSLDELLTGGVAQGIASTKEGVLAAFRENILKNWMHRDNPGNGNVIVETNTGEVIDTDTGETVLPNFVDTAAETGGIGGGALLALGTFIAVASYRNSQRNLRPRRTRKRATRRKR